MSDIAEALRQFPWRTDSQQHLAMRAAAHISQLEADFAEASKERSHQHGRADRNAREYANAQKTCEELRARIERLEAALREIADLKTYSEVSTAIKAAAIARAALGEQQ